MTDHENAVSKNHSQFLNLSKAGALLLIIYLSVGNLNEIVIVIVSVISKLHYSRIASTLQGIERVTHTRRWRSSDPQRIRPTALRLAAYRECAQPSPPTSVGWVPSVGWVRSQSALAGGWSARAIVLDAGAVLQACLNSTGCFLLWDPPRTIM
jgi:hypothetical protein